MSDTQFLVAAKPAPPLNVPKSSSTVTVRVIDSTSEIGIPAKLLVQDPVQGHDWVECPSYSFLLTHGDRHILFDLGVAKDIKHLVPAVKKLVDDGDWTLKVAKDVAEILNEDTIVGIKRNDIDTVIWSHHHWDHTGDMTQFPPSTALIVGPEFIATHTGKEDSVIVKPFYEGRSFREVDFSKEGKGLKIGRCDAIDFFQDGSFYLLSTPGHAVGHICGLARVSTNPDSFVFMAGDASHHCGEFRPTEWYPLPRHIDPSPLNAGRACPGELVQSIHRNKRADEAFYLPSDDMNTNKEEAIETIHKLEEFDAAENVLMMLAHDTTLLNRIPFFPETINDWYKKDLAKKTHWLFLKDFEKALEDK